MAEVVRRPGSPIVALGFAMVVTMWAVAYICRLPAVMAPSWLLLVLLLAAVAGWGMVAGRRVGGWSIGLAAGVTASVVNMLVLGSLLGSPESVGVRPSALWWVPGSMIVVAGVAAVAAAFATYDRSIRTDWTAMLSKVGVAATFLLVVAGGLVTSHEAGLAVVDWPNTFGYNMFLYPLTRMTGGIYYEHAHRLFGALVGLTTIVMAAQLWRVESRRWVPRLALLAVGLVILQGILGGLRVTGRFTMSTSLEDVAPNIGLAVAHGVLGQVFLGLMVALAVVTSARWKGSEPPRAMPNVVTDRSLQLWLVAALLVQLVLGAVQRHLAQGLLIHITLAAVVTMLAIVAGARAWGLYRGVAPIDRFGQAVMAMVAVQITLGIAALAVTQGRAVVGDPTTLEVTMATAHQAGGALLLALAVALALWSRRALAPETGS
jgi:cytochrome c oxidase assembly protein subunit 15